MTDHHDDCVLFNDSNRDAVRGLIDARINCAFLKAGGIIFTGAVILFTLIFYTYNQSENYSNNKIDVLIAATASQKEFSIKMQRSLDELMYMMKADREDIARNSANFEAQKKKTEREFMDIKQLITTLGNN